MQQYFIQANIELNELVSFNDEQSHHLKTVLKMKEESTIRLVDERQFAYFAKLRYLDGKAVALPFQLSDEVKEMQCSITLIQGMIKGEKWDWLLMKASELGVHTIVPLLSARTVVKSNEDKLDKKLARWNKITLEACEQSKRNHCVEVTPPVSLSKLSQYMQQANFVAYENADTVSSELKVLLKQSQTIAIVIGPEGGFEDQEIEQLEAMGFKRCSLGSRILRAETAALFALSVIQTILK